MQSRLAVVALTLLVCWGQSFNFVHAAVVVLANRSSQEVRFSVSATEAKPRPYTLAKGEVKALPLKSDVDILFSTGGKQRRCRVRLNEIYCFISDAATLQLTQVGLSGAWRNPPRPGPRSQAEDSDKDGVLVKVPVKIFVDQAEPTVQKVWEKRLRERVKKASAILERYCRVQVEVVDAGTWESDSSLPTLSELLRDFRDKASPGKARLAIGFTGLRPEKSTDKVLGCTPAPLHKHILLREHKLGLEVERLEVLVHELGHFFGAGHSPEDTSVMRTKLGDGRVKLKSFPIAFDPLNTLAMNLISEELAQRPVRGLPELSAPTRRRLLDIFSTLSRVMPDDPAAPYYVRLLGGKPPEAWASRNLSEITLNGARSVVTAITDNAKQNRRRSSGDELTERYLRLAAAYCRRMPAEDAPAAFTLGLAIALDREAMLSSLPLRGISWEKIENAAERGQRLKVLGQPTIHGSASLLRNFLFAAALPLLVEDQTVSAAAIQEELLLLQSGDRFRFDDLAAGLAGITFATQFDASPSFLGDLSKSFRIGDYVLSPKEVPDTLDREEFGRQYGSTTDKRFLDKQDALRKCLLALPGFQPHPQKDG